MGEHTGPVTVYRTSNGHWRDALPGSGATLGLYAITVLAAVVGRFLLLVSVAGGIALGVALVMLWIGVWTVRRTAHRVRISDRYHWDRAHRGAAGVVRYLPATGLLQAAEVRAVVQRELDEIVDLLVEQDRFRAVQRAARCAADDLPDGEPVRRELDDHLVELDERLRGVVSLLECRIARLVGLAAEATDLATLEARRHRARQAAARVRRELRRREAGAGGDLLVDAAGDAVDRAEAILAAYRELAQRGSTTDDG